jgi:uncharacterized protein YqkB
MAEVTNFSFMRPEETAGGDGPIKQFFQRLFNRSQGGLVGDAPARLVKKKEDDDDTNPYGFRIHTPPERIARKAQGLPRFDPARRASEGAISDGEKRDIDEDERQRMLAYMRHPSYKERLKKEIFYDSFNPNDKRYQKTVDDEYKRRIQDMESIPISRAKFSTQAGTEMPYAQYFPYMSYHDELPGGVRGPLGKTPMPQIVMGEDDVHNEINTNPNLYRQALGHELGHASHAARLGGWAYYDDPKKIPNPGMVVGELEKHAKSPLMKQKYAVQELMSPDWNSNFEKTKNRIIETATQKIGPEKVKQILEAQKRLNAEYEAVKKEKGRKYAQEKGPNWSTPELNSIQNNYILDHLDQNDTEVATRMIGLRRLAAEKFGHDMNEDFDIKKYKPQIQEYFKKNGMIDEYNQLNKTLELSDDQINEMMKYIAQNQLQQQTGRYTG